MTDLMKGIATPGGRAQKLAALKRERTSLNGKIKRRKAAITKAQAYVRDMEAEVRQIEKQIAEMGW